MACYRNGWLRVDRKCEGQGIDAPVVERTKTGRIREIPCDTRLSAWIETRMPRDPGAPLFAFDGHRWSHATLSDTWRRACKAVGVRSKFYEGTKHTFATDRLNQPGVREEDVQAFLGHADVRSTRI
ncbi:MAG: tyrosine-type recombinase/integrase [Deltaproteobacteria bacterium]|nr:tyrosine-type recombinase/integrase [Deltaproteobacteria bacterium]